MIYTPGDGDHVETEQAVNVTEQFELSRQFWVHQVDQGILSDPKAFINSVPHLGASPGMPSIMLHLLEMPARTSSGYGAGAATCVQRY